MKNIWKIIKDDFKKLFSSAISMCVVVGLIAVPTIYSLFNIAGYWDPYSGTSNLDIAIVNEDQGYSTDALPIEVKLGEYVMSGLEENKDFNWIISDYNSAMDKLYSDKYYAVLVIPSNFSEQWIDILAGKSDSAKIEYYANQKKSPITPKLIDNGITSIQNKINTSFSATVYQSVLNFANKITQLSDSSSVSKLKSSLTKSFGDAKTELENLNLQIQTIKTMLVTIDSSIDIANNLLSSGDSSKISELYNKLDIVKNLAATSRQYINNAIDILQQHGLLQDLQALLNDLSAVCSDIENMAASSQKIIDDSKNLNESLQSNLQSLKNFTSELNKQITSLETFSTDIIKDLQSAIDRVSGLSQSSSLEELKKIIGDNPYSFAKLISAPVTMEKHELYPVENFGTAISGFFISLSCWAGCLILCTMLITKLSRKRQKKMEKTGTFKAWQLYFGRYAIFGFLAFMQSTVMCFGCIFFLQIKMVHPFLFLLTGWIIAICFSFFIYTLVTAFGSAGKVIAVILLVLQVAATGGTFPIVMMTDAYQYIYPYLPVTYSIKAFNMCIAGFSDIAVYWQYIGIIFGTMTVISLIIGLILRVPNAKLAEWFEGKLHDTKLFAI